MAVERNTGSHPALVRSPRPRGSGESAGFDAPASHDPTFSDLQTLLSAAVERLVERTDAERACAWALRPGAGGFVAAAWSREGETARTPGAETLAAAAALTGPVDLGLRGTPFALRTLADEQGFSAAVPVRAEAGEAARALAVLLIGGSQDPPGAVRPRTLAALADAARRLQPSAETAAAVSRLGQLDDEVRRVDRLAALGDLLAEIAHEVRNPLVSVKTFLQLLPDRMDDEEFKTHFLDVVGDELRRVERLLDLVLEHARPGAEASLREGIRTEVAPVLDAVRRLLTHRAQERGVAIRVEAEPALPEAPIPPDALRQVALNLAMNALDASALGGEVVLRARTGAGGIEVEVEDDGPGVAPEHRAHVFEPFYSTKPERPGGLGLAICKRIADDAGGTLTVTDAPHQGALFRLTLPSA